MAQKIKSFVIKVFKMNGFTLRSEGSAFLTEVLAPINEIEREDFIDKLLESIQKQNLESDIIERDVLEPAVKDCGSHEEDSGQTFSVIDAFEVPKFIYSKERKKFLSNDELGLGKPSLFGSAEEKGELFRNRYLVLYQRTIRHRLFTPPIPGLDEVNSKKFQLKNVEYLLGCTSKLKDIIVLGMIAQLKEGKYYLEDLTGAVEMDLTNAKFHSGLFTENSFVLAEGWYDEQVFHISAFGFPPLESSKTTRAYYGNLNFFGGSSHTSVKASTKLLKFEQDRSDAMFVFLSDVFLDQEKVVKKLETLFIGFQDFPPVCFVFCGSFCSQPYGLSHRTNLEDGLKALAKVLKRFPSILAQSKMVFVPSPEDYGLGQILPRPAIPDVVTDEFCAKVPNAIFASNPCRIQYCTQELIIYRDDIVKKMCKNSIRGPTTDINEQFVKSVLSQGHLSPLPIHINPVYWSHDHALSLYPVPDVIVFSDRHTEPFDITQIDCKCLNPGSFSSGDFCFKVYYPASRTVDDSKIED
ncbi:DNA polymerase epsilon subunit 2 [Ciona intestinalis]